MNGGNLQCVLSYLGLLLMAGEAVRITMLQQFGRSHHMTTQAIGVELARRGHTVTICRPGKKENDGNISKEEHSLNILHFYQGFEQSEMDTVNSEYVAQQYHTLADDLNFYRKNFGYLGQICKSIVSNKQVMKEILAADILVTEVTLTCTGVIAHRYKKKWIGIIAGAYPQFISYFHRVYLNPSIFPDATSVYSHNMTFPQRVINFVSGKMFNIMTPLFGFYAMLDFALEYNFELISPIDELGKAEIIIGNCDFAVLYAYPQSPNNFCVGPLLTKPPKELPDDLKHFMNSSKHGVILVAFGTLFGFYTPKQAKAMAGAFGRLKENVIWQIKGDILVTLPPNVKALKWVPQNDLLGHPNLKLFVSHVGQSSFLEAAYHGIPVLAVPRAIDQHYNAVILREKVQMGEILDINTADEEEWFQKIQTVLSTESYSLNARKASRRIRSRKQTPLERAGDLIQYVIDNEYDVSHLRLRGPDLPWYITDLLDVYLFLILVLVSVLFILYYLFRKAFLFLYSKKLKSE